jgi:hypothetical protein
VAITLASLLCVNAFFYVALMHLLYAILLRALGYAPPALPRSAQRALDRRAAAGA